MLNNKKALVMCQVVMVLLLVVSLTSLGTWRDADWLGKLAFLIMYIAFVAITSTYGTYRLGKNDLIGAWGFSILPSAILMLALTYVQATASL